MHWVSAAHAISAEIRLYDKLFPKPDPNDFAEGQDDPRQSQPQLPRNPHRRQAGAFARRRQSRRPLPIRARRLLLPGPRLHRREAGLQPHPPPERLLGQNRKEVWSVEPPPVGCPGSSMERAAAFRPRNATWQENVALATGLLSLLFEGAVSFCIDCLIAVIGPGAYQIPPQPTSHKHPKPRPESPEEFESPSPDTA